MGYLYDGIDMDMLGGGFLYDQADTPPQVPDSLLYRDRIIVQPMVSTSGPHGVMDVPDPDNPPAYCYCCVEGRTQKNSVFSEDWAQDTTPTAKGGLRSVTLVRVMAVEWHGDIHTRMWWRDSWWQCDGQPVHIAHGTALANHWEFPMRLIGENDRTGMLRPPTVPEGARIWGM